MLSIAVLFLAGFKMNAAKESYFPVRSTLKMDGNGKGDMYYLYDRLTDEDDTLSANTEESLCSSNVLFFYRKTLLFLMLWTSGMKSLLPVSRTGKSA